jgi:hypothetical protein
LLNIYLSIKFLFDYLTAFFVVVLVQNPSSSPQDEHHVHPAIDHRVALKSNVQKRKTTPVASKATASAPSPPPNPPVEAQPAPMNNKRTNNSSRSFPKSFGNKNLESILARLDVPNINPKLVENMDESNPNIVLEFLLESNKYTQITNNLSDDDVFVILKYFNDFLTNDYPGNFQKLRELKIYKPLWGSVSEDEKQQQIPIQQCCSLENFAHVHILNEEWSNIIRRSFRRNFFTEQFHEKKTVLLMQKKIESLSKIFHHLRFNTLNDLEIFSQLCLPYFRKLDAKSQANLFKYLIEEIDERLSPKDKEQCRKHLRDHLEIFTQASGNNNDYVQKTPAGISKSSVK